ncbi:MAG: hypothetical protein HZA29_04325 [Candidatus Omnitrophica bacterium]|nr:hypothetical protein [Candidatus Omnitrophota bacterium]
MLKRIYCSSKGNIFPIFLIMILLGISLTISANTGSSSELPPLPVIRLVYNDKAYEGMQGSYCWPNEFDGGVAAKCVDMNVEPSETISVAKGDTLIVKVEAREAPSRLTVNLSPESGTPIDGGVTSDKPTYTVFKLAAVAEAPFTVDIPADVYTVEIFGDWPKGDMSYTFRIAVLNGVAK